MTGETLLDGDKIVQNIICSSIAEDYDAYTWIKPNLNDSNRRFVMVALRRHFSGGVADQVLGGQATLNFDKLFYRSEHEMSFEAFVTKFINAINNKDRAGRTMSDPDIFETI